MKHDNQNNKTTEKPCFITLAQFCAYLKLSRSTFYRKIKDLGEQPPGKLIAPDKQKKLCESLGVPYFFDDEK